MASWVWKLWWLIDAVLIGILDEIDKIILGSHAQNKLNQHENHQPLDALPLNVLVYWYLDKGDYLQEIDWHLLNPIHPFQSTIRDGRSEVRRGAGGSRLHPTSHCQIKEGQAKNWPRIKRHFGPWKWYFMAYKTIPGYSWVYNLFSHLGI